MSKSRCQKGRLCLFGKRSQLTVSLKIRFLQFPKELIESFSKVSKALFTLVLGGREKKMKHHLFHTHHGLKHPHSLLALTREGTTFFSNWQRIMGPLFPSYKPLPSCLWKIYGINSPSFALLPVTLVVTSHTDSGLGRWEGSKLDASRHLWKHSICLPSSLSTCLHCSAGALWDTYRE